MRAKAIVLAAFTTTLLTGAAHAGDVWKCGSTWQDRPCDNAAAPGETRRAAPRAMDDETRERVIVCHAFVASVRRRDWQEKGERWTDAKEARWFNECVDRVGTFRSATNDELRRETR